MYKYTLILLLLLLPAALPAQDSLRLSPPQTAAERLFAGPQQTVSFEFRLSGAVIRYTTNGTEPDEQSALYKGPLPATTDQTIKARAFCEGFLPSPAVTVQVLQPGGRIKSLLADTPAPQYNPGVGALFNGQLGGSNLRQHWLGYNKTTLRMTVYPGRRKKISTIAISMLRRQSAWIFLPKEMTVYDAKGMPLTILMMPDVHLPAADAAPVLTLDIPAKKYKRLTIEVQALPILPEWHAGKGQPGWVFVDEVMVW